MLRLYHKQKVFLAGFLLLIAFLFIRPLLPYVGQGLGLASSFLFGSISQLRSSAERTNILVLGLGGPKNEPAGLTDTLIFTSVDQGGGPVILISLARDIWIPEIRAKLNSAYYYGNREEGLGLEWARRYTQEILGQPVHYVFVLSFDGFVKLVDTLGGVEVVVERGFIDAQYPIPGRENDTCGGDPTFVCRFETVTFNSGRQFFDGATALKFARSRNAPGVEGTDFARANRQQKIILAIKDKVTSPTVILNPAKMAKLFEILSGAIDTDIPQSHFGILTKLALVTRSTKVVSEVLDGGFLFHPQVSPKYDNQWVVIPKGEDWSQVQEWTECLLVGSKNSCFSNPKD